MARSILEIYNEMIDEKQSLVSLQGLQPNIDSGQDLLNELTTISKVGVWRLLFFIVAVAIWAHEVIFDRHEEKVEERANELVTGTEAWYRDQCFLFQYGDSLSWNGKRYVYATIDTLKQIIERAAVNEVAGQVRIKVAKLDNGLPVPLASAEKTAFEAYIAKVKFAGTNVSIISEDADTLKLVYEVTYDPLVMNGNGELISDTSIRPVDDAINGYIQNLPFDGVLNLTKLTDEVQKAQGVIDPVLQIAQARYGNISYQSIVKNYNANAGHMIIDPNFPLDTQITYIAANV